MNINNDLITSVDHSLQLLAMTRQVFICWAKGHSGLCGNEYVDNLANRASSLSPLGVIAPTSITSLLPLPAPPQDRCIGITPSLNHILGVLNYSVGSRNHIRLLDGSGIYLNELSTVRRI